MPKKREKEEVSLEEKLKMAIVPKEEEPYKVPDNWLWTKIKNVNEVVTGGTPSKKIDEYWENKDINFVKPSDLYQGRNLNFSEEFIDVRAKEKVRMIPKYSTILCCIGSIGKSAYSEIECCTNQQINSLIPKKDLLNPLYNYYYSNSQYFINQMQNSSSATTIAILNKSKTEELYFPLPPIEEQKRIVNKLDYFFEKIQKVKEIIEEVKEKSEARKESILSKAFTGELTAKWRADNIHSAKELLSKINDEKLSNWDQDSKKAEEEGRKKPSKPKLKSVDEMIVPNDEIPYQIPDNWVWTRLGDLVDVKGGKRVPKGEEFSKEPTKNVYLRVTDFKSRSIDLENLKYISDEIAEKINAYKISVDDIYLSIAGTIGKVGIIPKEINNSFLTENACKLTNMKCLNQRYLLNVLESPFLKLEIKKAITSSGQPKLAIFRIENFPIPLPPIEEQKEIVRILDNIFTKENLIDELISLEDKIQILEKSILDKAFRGELGTNSTSDTNALELLKEILQK